jgi:hypothetical protein
VSAKQTISTRNKLGQDEEKARKKTRWLTSLVYSNGRIAHMTKKLFRQNEKNEVDAGLN